jgi:integrase
VLYHNRDFTREQLRQILSKASQRDRTIWLVMAESGLRANTAISMRYWQIKDDFEKDIIPMRILTPSESLKDHVGDRWSFIGEDGVKALREYLKPRMPLKDQDFVFASEKAGLVTGEQFSVASISVKFRRVVTSLKLEKGSPTIGKPGHFRMHGLRKYFRNNMKADPSYREFWMGHSLGVDEHYVTRDPEAHRAEYRKGYESLRILEPATPAQLTEIVEQLKKKDLEIQELRKEITEQGETIDLLMLQAPVKDPKQQARIILKVMEILKRKEPRKEKESA